MPDSVTYNPSAPWLPTPNASQYGRDLSCIIDLDADMSESTGRQLLAEALARRIITPSNTLIDDPAYGYDLMQFINDDIDRRKLAEMAQQTRDQFRQDDRVKDCAVEVSFTGTGGVLIVSATVFDAQGPFKLTAGIDSVDLAFLKVA